MYSLKDVDPRVIFEENFYSFDEVAQNAGTVVGAPTIVDASESRLGRAIDLDGTNDALVYPGFFSNKQIWSVEIWFKPDFDGWNGQEHWFFCHAGDKYLIYIDANKSIYIRSGAGYVLVVPENDYKDEWNTGEWNQMLVSVDALNGPNHCYLNDVLVQTSVSTEAGVLVSDFQLARRSAGHSPAFDSKIGSIRVWDLKLTADEVSDLYNFSTYRYNDYLKLHLPCFCLYNNAGAERPYLNPRIGGGNSTFTATHSGIEVANGRDVSSGGTDRIQIANHSDLPGCAIADFSISMRFVWDGDIYWSFLYDTGSWQTAGARIQIDPDGTLYASAYWSEGDTSVNTGSLKISTGVEHTVVVSYDVSTWTLKLYVDGEYIGSDTDASTPIVPSTSAVSIGNRAIASYDKGFKGQLVDVRFYARPLTTTQARDIY